MRKFKVVKHWPCGPIVGETLKMIEGGTYLEQYPEARWSFPYVEIKDYIEEVKEPDVFWWIKPNGTILNSFDSPSLSMDVLKEFQFRTKESAEKFAKALKDSYGDLAWRQMYLVEQALNDRVK